MHNQESLTTKYSKKGQAFFLEETKIPRQNEPPTSFETPNLCANLPSSIVLSPLSLPFVSSFIPFPLPTLDEPAGGERS